MRTLPASFFPEANAQESGARFFVLVEISHGYVGVPSPIRLTDMPGGVNYGGNIYGYCPFNFDFPDSKESGPGIGRMTLGATAEIVEAIRSVEGGVYLKAIAVIWPDSGIVEPVASYELTLKSISGTMESLTADLVYEDRLQNEFPADEGTPSCFPGMF